MITIFIRDDANDKRCYCYFAYGRDVKYCDERVCLSVCPLAYLNDHTSKLIKFSVGLHVSCGRGSVLF